MNTILPTAFRRSACKGGHTHVKKQFPGWAALLIITLIAGLALGCTYTLTKDPIDRQNALNAENARKAVLPLADTFQPMPETVFAGKVDGFAGPVYVEYVPDDEGKIAAITIGNPDFAETPNFGAKALAPEFAAQFIGKFLPVGEGDVDLITRATITSKAVLNAINTAEKKDYQVDWCYAGYQGEALVGYVAQVTVQGFGGPVEVIVGVDTDLTLTGVSVGGSSFAETAGLGAKAKDKAFTDQFIGKTVPVTVIKAGGKAADNTVDALTSATITSNAVAGAVNTAASHVKGILFPGMDEEIILPEKPAGAQVYSASAKGFAGPVYVEYTLDNQGKISYISIGDDQFKETAGFGQKALDPAFMYQFIGMKAPTTLDDIDAISGATITSRAVVDAVNAAMGVEPPVVDTTTDATSAATGEAAAEEEVPTVDTTTDATSAATGEAAVEKADANVKSASVQGFAGPVYVEYTLDGEGKIATIKVGDDNFAETPGFGAKAREDDFTSQFIGKVPPLAYADIDAVTYATITSHAVVDAVNAAMGVEPPVVDTTTDATSAATGEAAAEEEVPTVDTTTDATSAATGEAAVEKADANVKSASVQGFAGPVYVEYTLDGDGKIATIKVGDNNFAETPGFGAKAREDDFTSQFIGKVPPLAYADIDAVTYATITSHAVVDAVNAAMGVEPPVVDTTTDATSAATGEAAAEEEVPTVDTTTDATSVATGETAAQSTDNAAVIE
ncbi:MAG: FMN-binding protein [Clostridiales bacterium]|nr:FMN-binding protein [Clostridiales bacterium]